MTTEAQTLLLNHLQHNLRLQKHNRIICKVVAGGDLQDTYKLEEKIIQMVTVQSLKWL